MVLPLLGTLLCFLSLYLLVVRPFMRVREARDWAAVPCRVISSEVVRTSSTGNRDVYRVEITVRYTVGGKVYTANRYDLMGDTGSGGYQRKARLVASYPPGRETTCFADPSDPTQAVINREYPARMWWGLLPLIFLPFGLGGFIMGAALAMMGGEK